MGTIQVKRALQPRRLLHRPSPTQPSPSMANEETSGAVAVGVAIKLCK